MKIDEAIDRYEKLAAEYEFKIMCNDDFNFSQPKWREAAAEYRQLAEWLKGYKRLMSCVKWKFVDKELPRDKGEYIVAYHPCYWGNVRKDQIVIGLDSFRGKTTWAKNKYQQVIAWMEKPKFDGENSDE